MKERITPTAASDGPRSARCFRRLPTELIAISHCRPATSIDLVGLDSVRVLPLLSRVLGCAQQGRSELAAGPL